MLERVQYKIVVLVYEVLRRLAPQYLGPLNYVADLPGCRPLRSAITNRLAMPPVKLTTVANRAFPIVGPRTWNDLPDNVTSAESLSIFASISRLISSQNHFLTISWTNCLCL